MFKRVGFALGLVALVAATGCGGKKTAGGAPGGETPDMVTVQHILIAFEGTVPDVERSQEEAQMLAQSLYQRAKAGEDFDMLVEEYTDDSFPGVYQMANHDSDANPDMTIFARSAMAKNFGDVAFSLQVGEVGLAEYDPQDCKYGWHVILRLE